MTKEKEIQKEKTNTLKKKKPPAKRTIKESSNQQIKKLEQQLKDNNDKYLRLNAEFDNYRKRTLKEKIELSKNAGEAIFVKILFIVDDFERALQALLESKNSDGVTEGLNLIYTKLKDFLSQNGIKEIESIGQDFDTDIHEAITKIKVPEEKEKGKIVDVVEKGYYLNEKVIRFSKVILGE